MKSRNAVSSFAIVVLATLLMGANAMGAKTLGAKTLGAKSLGAAVNGSAANICSTHSRYTFAINQLPAYLNYVYSCRRFICNGTPVQFEVKQIASYGVISQWLAQANTSSTPYSPAQQDAIIQTAQTLANINTPPSKFVYDIQFFYDIGVGAGSYVIGANVTYAYCSYRRNFFD